MVVVDVIDVVVAIVKVLSAVLVVVVVVINVVVAVVIVVLIKIKYNYVAAGVAAADAVYLSAHFHALPGWSNWWDLLCCKRPKCLSN